MFIIRVDFKFLCLILVILKILLIVDFFELNWDYLDKIENLVVIVLINIDLIIVLLLLVNILYF